LVVGLNTTKIANLFSIYQFENISCRITIGIAIANVSNC